MNSPTSNLPGIAASNSCRTITTLHDIRSAIISNMRYVLHLWTDADHLSLIYLQRDGGYQAKLIRITADCPTEEQAYQLFQGPVGKDMRAAAEGLFHESARLCAAMEQAEQIASGEYLGFNRRLGKNSVLILTFLQVRGSRRIMPHRRLRRFWALWGSRLLLVLLPLLLPPLRRLPPNHLHLHLMLLLLLLLLWSKRNYRAERAALLHLYQEADKVFL